MKQLAFYPGCALQSMSWDYRESINQVAVKLGLDLIEIPDWTCCGATAAHSLDERMSVILPARNLASAESLGLDLAVACPMCFKRLNYSRQMLEQKRVDDPWSLQSTVAIRDLARLLATEPMLQQIRENVENPLTHLRVVCYYGCQVVRPPKIIGFKDYENPQHLDRIAAAVGATPIDWSFKATCCGASIGIPKKELGLSLVNKLLMAARASGAQAIIVCCPLCQSNLDLYQQEICRQFGYGETNAGLPILYYTELLGIAFNMGSVRRGFKSHMVNPELLFDRIAAR